MKKYFSPLKITDILTLTGVLLLSFAWLGVDQMIFTGTGLRFAALAIVLTVLFYLQYFINKPVKVLPYVNSIASVIFIFAIILSVFIHVIIKNDLQEKIVAVFFIVGTSVIIPYISGILYLIARRK